MMRYSSTLSKYLAKSYFVNMLAFLAALLMIIYLFDTVELLRRAGKQDGVGFGLVAQLGLFKLPEVGQLVFPFVILFSAIFTFWQLNRRLELVVVRSSGFSVWQFLSPVLAVALFIGLFNVTLVNPIGASLLKRFEVLENEYLSHKRNYVTVLREGLWLRQIDEQGGQAIIHAEEIDIPEWKLGQVIVLFFNAQDDFVRRIDAPHAYLRENAWVFEDAINHVPLQKSTEHKLISLPTTLTAMDLEESFASPETISFWNLPEFIETMEIMGLDSTDMKIHYQSMIAQPLMFAAMILLAATVSLRPPRQKGTFGLILLGIFVGFFIFFMSSFLKALGASHQIPIILAAWAPALVTALLGISVMLNQEDG